MERIGVGRGRGAVCGIRPDSRWLPFVARSISAQPVVGTTGRAGTTGFGGRPRTIRACPTSTCPTHTAPTPVRVCQSLAIRVSVRTACGVSGRKRAVGRACGIGGGTAVHWAVCPIGTSLASPASRGVIGDGAVGRLVMACLRVGVRVIVAAVTVQTSHLVTNAIRGAQTGSGTRAIRHICLSEVSGPTGPVSTLRLFPVLIHAANPSLTSEIVVARLRPSPVRPVD